MGFAHQLEFVTLAIVAMPMLAGAVQSIVHGVSPMFDAFITEHGRLYKRGSPEYEQRREIFEKNLDRIRAQNSAPDHLWSAELNHLSDRTDVELSELRGLRVSSLRNAETLGSVRPHGRGGQFVHPNTSLVVPHKMSWANLTTLREDTNQGRCGSCWAVATATMLAANAEINGYSRSFSAQELISCVPNPHHCGGSGGCHGSTVELAMNWVVDRGLASANAIPYVGADTTCKALTAKASKATSLVAGHETLQEMIAVGFHSAKSNSAGARLGLYGWARLAQNAYEPLLRAVALTGPVAISMAARSLHLYGSGIFDQCFRDAIIDHAVVLIGYGKDEQKGNTRYWEIKNSWGLAWGERGNFRMLRHVGNTYCGTDNYPADGTGCDGGPTSVKVCGMCGMLYDSVVAVFKHAPVHSQQ